MMSHCTASLKLTPWHEGTFASSVIYSPPQLPPFPLPFTPLVSNPLSPSSLSLLPQNDIHYFIVRQESFFSCSLGTKRKGKGEKKRRRQAKSQLGQVSQWQLVLFSLWPGAPVESSSVLQCYRVSGEIQLHVWGTACWVRTAGKGLSVRVSVRILTSSNHRRAGITLQLAHRCVGIAFGNRKYN